MRRTCGEPNALDLTAIGLDLNGSRHVTERRLVAPKGYTCAHVYAANVAALVLT